MPDLDHWKSYVKKLDDRFGDYVLIVRRQQCSHSREVMPEAFARIVGWAAQIDDLVKRLRCSKCAARGPTWDVGRTPRPRGRDSRR